VSWAQINALGVGRAAVARWMEHGYLHRVLPRVYAVGHRAPSVEGDLAAALLYAGPGAMLSHAIAVWWFGLVDRRPARIEVSTPRRCRSRRGIKVYPRRNCERIWHNGFPVTSVTQGLLDFAATAPFSHLRRAVAVADYRRLLDLAALESALGRGRPGSAKLRKALDHHMPRLALTRSPLEDQFFALCEAKRIPLPEINARVEGITVDALWREERLVVELDGHDNHSSRAQIRRDRRNELRLRSAGYRVNRYTSEQVEGEGDAVARDVLAALSLAAPSASPGSH
jgi:hypothetical protein